MSVCRIIPYLFLLLAASATLKGEVQPSEWATDTKGFVGENLVDEFYSRSGRQELLGKLCPTGDGPDRIYKCPDGTVEVHEVKFNGEWRGKASLWHEVNGKRMCELSDEWLELWINRVRVNPWANERERSCAELVKANMKSGKLIRVFDEINHSDGKFHSFRVSPAGPADVSVEELQGPLRIEKFLAKANRLKLKYEQGQAAFKGLDRKLFNEPRVIRLSTKPRTFGDYAKALGTGSGRSVKVCRGALLSDGRLLVITSEAGGAAAFIVGMEGGVAVYQYVKGDIWAPAFQEKLADAAVKGAAVGTATAVAVAVGFSPGGIVVLAVAAGTYVIAEAALREYHSIVEGHFLKLEDLQHYGHELRSSLADADAHSKEGDKKHFGHPL
jgi:hypothetical protein